MDRCDKVVKESFGYWSTRVVEFTEKEGLLHLLVYTANVKVGNVSKKDMWGKSPTGT